MLLSVKVWIRPDSYLFADRLLEPAFVQIVMLRVAQRQRLHGRAVTTHGVREEPASLLGVVVGYEADAAAVDARIGGKHTLHDVIHPVRTVQVLLDDGSRINGSDIHIRHDATHLLILSFQHLFADNVGAKIHRAVAHKENQERRNTHDDQHT